MEQIVDIPVPLIVEEIAEVMLSYPQGCTPEMWSLAQ